MACGCLCVGFTGFGGWDYMRQVEAHGYAPHGYTLRDVPWGGNGWWSADGDVLGAALGLERAVRACLEQGGERGLIQDNCARTTRDYGSEMQQRRIESLFLDADGSIP